MTFYFANASSYPFANYYALLNVTLLATLLLSGNLLYTGIMVIQYGVK